MNADPQQPDAEVPPAGRCPLCGEPGSGVCPPCVEGALRRLLPDLARALEGRYGRQLDEWLACGRFTVACWEVEPEFGIGERRLLAFLTEVVRDAFRARTVSLELPHADPYVPADAAGLASAINGRCGRGLRLLLAQHLAIAIRGAPTLLAERELVEVMSGRRGATRRGRREALDAAAFTTANPLRGAAAVLLQLRYGARRDVAPYTEVSEGEIDPVWREVEELLPEEVAVLLPAGGECEGRGREPIRRRRS
jgi:hypothetical protein